MKLTDERVDFVRAIFFVIVALVTLILTFQWDSNIISAMMTFVDMVFGKYRVLSDPANNYRIILKMIAFLATVTFVVLTYLDGSLNDILDGTVLLLVCLHLAYHVKLGFNKTLDSHTWY